MTYHSARQTEAGRAAAIAIRRAAQGAVSYPGVVAAQAVAPGAQ
jgi:hypothetical protein